MDAELSEEMLGLGVSLELARLRAGSMSDIRYRLSLRIPAASAAPIEGSVSVRFVLASVQPVVFDFAAAPLMLREATIAGRIVDPLITPEHVVVSAESVQEGENEITFDFLADSRVLNRQSDFVYSLFVPARARFVFPCFDQPDMKARFNLALSVPAGWQAVSNTSVEDERVTETERIIRFRQTELLPTYLFAFAAGALSMESDTRDGRVFRVWHREEEGLLARNVAAVVDLHARALAWLESYTAVPYPFSQFDIVLIPSFQFSGMEHPGAIFYNAGRLLLESSATEHDHLTRASLIAHETAHLWFGDLVTMRWFDDVWLKEVFANFVAEKVIAEMFPGNDHALRFFLANYPGVYAVDRTAGTNAIKQPLDNLADAGQLYGPIIYLKAPIVFRQLELMLGERPFRDGVRRYLETHRFGNADWDDLLRHLAPGADAGLRSWSQAWIEEAGRPRITLETEPASHVRPEILACRTDDPTGHARIWPQTLHVAMGDESHVEHMPIVVRHKEEGVPLPGGRRSFVLGGGNGLGYGHFPLDAASREWLLQHAAAIGDAVTRGVAWAALWDDLLEGAVPATEWLDAILRSLQQETEAQNAEHQLAMLNKAFWLFLSGPERESVGPGVERCLHDWLRRSTTAPARASWLSALREMTITADGCRWLERVWRRQEPVPGLPLGEADETAIGFELAVREVVEADEVVEVQGARIQDSDRRSRLVFVGAALSADPRTREAAFADLADRKARAREPWALARLRYLNHPLRQAHARRFITPGLAQLPDIMKTGDIFFPARWADALLSGHSSPAAALAVRQFLVDRADFPSPLRRAVLVASDLLFRAGFEKP